MYNRINAVKLFQPEGNSITFKTFTDNYNNKTNILYFKSVIKKIHIQKIHK